MTKIDPTKQTLNHVWSLLCDKSSIDQKSNLLSIFNVIDEITLSDLKKDGKSISGEDLKESEIIVVKKEINLISMWRRGIFAGQGPLAQKIRVEWISPNGKILLFKEGDINLEAGKRNVRVIFVIDKMAFTVPGVYILRLLATQEDDSQFENINEVPIDVKMV